MSTVRVHLLPYPSVRIPLDFCSCCFPMVLLLLVLFRVVGTSGAARPVACPPGTAQPEASASSCKLCVPGSFSSESNSTACTLCPPGTFSQFEGATACELCSSGGYCQFAGAASGSEATDCPVGTYNPVPGATNASACIACAPGKANEQEGMKDAAACIDCSPETFSDQPGAEHCEECWSGTFQVNVGATACELCTPGSFCLGQEVGRQPCPSGTWSDDIRLGDLDACKDCPRGFYCGTGTTTPQRERHPPQSGRTTHSVMNQSIHERTPTHAEDLCGCISHSPGMLAS